jgi:hypothetical protein
MRQSYCEKQINALYRACNVCWRFFFFTDHKQTECTDCWRRP